MPNSRIDWSRDELILALDVYFKVAPGTPGPNLPIVRKLSALLRGAQFQPVAPASDNFRSPASVVMKLMNFRSIDPTYGGKGLTAGGRLDQSVWQDFATDPKRLSVVANAIRTAAYTPPELGDEGVLIEAEEGAILSRMHRVRERDPRLTRRKRNAVLSACGRLTCEVCSFDFGAVYGDLGKDYIECHHRRPLSDLPHARRTRLEDLALLCANCHRMIHARRPWLTVEKLKDMFLSVGERNR